MSEDEKKYYKNLGDQCNSNQRQNKVKVPEQITETHNNSKEYYLMCSYLKKMFEETILNEAGKNYLVCMMKNIFKMGPP